MDSDKFSLTDFVSVQSPDLFKKGLAFAEFLKDVRIKGLEAPYLCPSISRRDNRVRILDAEGEREVILMCSANYLGLASHYSVVSAAKAALDQYGASVCAVPLIAGTTDVSMKLEEALAGFKGVERAVLFPTGHAANQGVISALVSSRDWVVVDKQIHHSIIEGVQLSRGHLASFRHSDMSHLEKVLDRIRRKHHDCGILVVGEGVYGIDGDIAPLPELMGVSRRFDARIMIDECHSTGVIGRNGAGTASHYELKGKPDLVMDSLSKALGSMGGWIGTSQEVADYLRYYAKPISFSVGLPPVSAAAALASLDLISNNPDLVSQVQQNAGYMRSGLADMGVDNVTRSGSAIMSVIIGDEPKLRRINRELFKAGLWAEGIPYPAVPRGQERLRLRVMASHTREDLDQALNTLEDVLKEYKVISGRIGLCHLHKSKKAHRVEAAKREIMVAQSVADLARVAHFLWHTESSDKNGVAWYSIDDKTRFLSGHYLYHRQNVKIRTFFSEGGQGIEATATAFVDRRAIIGGKILRGFIGCLGVRSTCEDSAAKVIQAALDFLTQQGCEAVWAPVDVPALVFGGGIVHNPKGLIPFFQPYYPQRYREILLQIGFAPKMVLPYYTFQLGKERMEMNASDSNGTVRIREISKLKWPEEAAGICEIINMCFVHLGHHWGIDPDEWDDLVKSFLDLVYPDLWLIAEVGQRMAGFVGAFPCSPEVFRSVGGEIGTADLEQLAYRLEKARQGSIVWLAVLPEFSNLGIGKHLIRSVLKNMARKGYLEATVTWEIFDPDSSADDLIKDLGGHRAGYEIEIFEKKNVSGKGVA